MPPSFGRRAQSYDRYAHIQREMADWLSAWLPERGEFGSCLEFGAGTGLLTRHLKGRFDAVEASDGEGSMVDACRQRVRGVNHRQRDAWQVQDSAESWDYIASSSLLQWAPAPLQTLRAWRRILAPGGRMLAGLFVSPSLQEMARVLPGAEPLTWRPPGEWAELVRTAGLRILKTESRSRRRSYPSAQALWKSLHRTGAVVPRGIPRRRLIRAWDLYESMFGDPSGVYATWTMCRILAERQSAPNAGRK